MSATLASAQGTSASIEQRLQQLEAEQAAMKQQLADRDQLIQDLRKELQSQGGVDGAGCRLPRQRLLRAVAGSALPPAAATAEQGRGSRWIAGDAATHAAIGRDLGCLRPG